jgi:hypothetical protein
VGHLALSKKQRLTELCRKIDAHGGCGGWSRGVAVMTNLSRALIACISVTMMLPGAASIAAADTFTYELNGSYAESNGGPSLVPNGGTLGPGGRRSADRLIDLRLLLRLVG